MSVSDAVVLGFVLVVLALFLYFEYRGFRGTAAERLLDRFRLGAKKPEKPRRSLLHKIREAHNSRARTKDILDSLTYRPPSERGTDIRTEPKAGDS